MEKNNLWELILGGIAYLSIVVALYLIFLVAPEERVMGIVQKIFYFHVPSAWVAFLAFFVVFIGSIMFLFKRDYYWDAVSLASAEIGVVFTTIVITTGPIWAKTVWNAWWTWDPKLTTAIIMWFIYLAYVVLRLAAGEEEKTARFAAIFGIIGFLDVPLVFAAGRWWQKTFHPIIFNNSNGGLDPAMKPAFFVSLFAFTILYFYFLVKSTKINLAQREINRLKDAVNEKIYG